jgi:Surface-adhesin protein E
MKSLSVKLGVVLIGLAIFACAEVWGADWKHYASNEDLLGYYDAQGITGPSENIVSVWTRLDYTEKGVLGWVKKFGKTFENLDYVINLNEINCLEKKFRILLVYYYDSKGSVFDSIRYPSEWTIVVPESIQENLYEEVCK